MWLYCLIATKVRNKKEMRAEKGEIPFILPPFMHVLASMTMIFQVVRDARTVRPYLSSVFYVCWGALRSLGSLSSLRTSYNLEIFRTSEPYNLTTLQPYSLTINIPVLRQVIDLVFVHLLLLSLSRSKNDAFICIEESTENLLPLILKFVSK